MSRRTRSSVIEQLIGSYFELPVRVDWARASGLPFPDEFHDARLAFAGIATAWLPLDEVIWHAAHVRFVPGMPARIRVGAPRVEIAVGRAELERWIARFELPYRLELTDDGLVVHTEIAGFPVARLDARLEVERGWFVLQPTRASVLGLPNYLASLFRTYLPLPPLAGDTRLEQIEHRTDQLRLTFGLPDFEELVTPGLLVRLQRRLMPTLALPQAGMDVQGGRK
jgi:hypothetical protein